MHCHCSVGSPSVHTSIAGSCGDTGFRQECPDIPEDRLDLEATSDDDVSTGSGFIYDDEVLNALVNDKFGIRRSETELEKIELVGTSTDVAG